MKKCPFCAEEIQDEAVKCRFCGEFLNNFPQPKPKVPWYFSTPNIVASFLFVGPLALPFVWLHPSYKKVTKIAITVVVGIITSIFLLLLFKLVPKIWDYYSQLGELTKEFKH